MAHTMMLWYITTPIIGTYSIKNQKHAYVLIPYFFTCIRMLDEKESDTYFLYGDILAGNKNVESQMKFFCKSYRNVYVI